jgi:DNA-binding NarL/FixJ family response regulator
MPGILHVPIVCFYICDILFESFPGVKMKKYDIVLVDDHALFRKGLLAALSSAGIADHIHEASNGVDFLEILDVCKPDVVLMDVSMPKMDGIEATRKAISRHPDLRVLALSMHNDLEHFHGMVEAGVMGFLSKDESLDDVIGAIVSVAEGENVFSRKLMQQLSVAGISPGKESEIFDEDEMAVLQQISYGLSNPEISFATGIPLPIVEEHREKIFRKSQTGNTAELIMFAIRHNLI